MKTGLVFLLVIGTLVGRVEARKVVWTVGTGAMVVSNVEGSEYVLEFSLPEGLENVRIDHATVEFFVDAADVEGVAPFHVRMVPATNVAMESPGYEVIDAMAVAFVGAGAGQGTRVRLDVTNAMRHWAASGGTVYAAIEGAGVTERAARLATNRLGRDAAARFTVWTTRRY